MAKRTRCGFNLAHYEDILISAVDSHKCVTFSEWSASVKPRICFRHDIDHSIGLALDMARIEAKHNVVATYFVQLHAATYSASSTADIVLLREIISLGHEVGLHYDTEYYHQLGASPGRAMMRDIEALSDITGVQVHSISQHNPIDSMPDRGLMPIGYLDAYSPQFTQQMKYISDSNMAWRGGCACQFITRPIDLQILTHPIWWVCNGGDLTQKIADWHFTEATHRFNDVGKLADYYQRCLNNRTRLDNQLDRMA